VQEEIDETRRELVKTDGGAVASGGREDPGAADGLNSCNKILLVCFTGDEACIHTS
jgi:hypothetical protein